MMPWLPRREVPVTEPRAAAEAVGAAK